MGICCCKHRYLRHNTKKKIVLLLVGLDNAGKTTAAKGLAGDIVEYTIPTVGFTAIKPKTKGCDVTIYDLGGGAQIRDIWTSYFHFVHGVIYVVDASDLSRIGESKNILENLLLNEKLAGKPVLVLANKQDKPNALDEIDVVENLQLEPLVNQQKCHTLVKVCSAFPSSSEKKKKIDKRLLSGYRWLLHQILKEYDVLNNRVECDSRDETERFQAQRALQRKRLEEFEKEEQVSNGTESTATQIRMNGVGGNSSTSDEHTNGPKNITSNIRDQLEQKNDRQRFLLSRGRRSNKIHPENGEQMDPLKRPKLRSILSSPYTVAETSMTLRALTSPLHIIHIPGQAQSKHRYTQSGRPMSSRSLGHDVGVWGLEREMDIIYPTQITKHIVTEDGVREEVVVEYLKKD